MGPFWTTARFGRGLWNWSQGDSAARDPSPSRISREMLQRLSVSQHFSLLEGREAEAILGAAFKDMARDCLDFFLPAGVHSWLIHACQAHMAAKVLLQPLPFAWPGHFHAPHSVLPVKRDSFTNGHHHHLPEEVELIGSQNTAQRRHSEHCRPLPRSLQIWWRCSHRLSLWEGEKIG